MDLAKLTIDAARLGPDEQAYDGPIAFIDLDRTDGDQTIALPSCPVIGLGKASHPLGDRVDAVVEPPVAGAALAAQVLAQPHAAMVAVGLLRMLPALATEDGLTAESFAYGLLQGSAAHAEWLASTERDRRAPRTRGRISAERCGSGLTITLDNAVNNNAIDRSMRDGLYEAFALAAVDQEIATVSLRALGRSFSLGADLSEFGTTRDPATAHAIRGRTLPARMIARCAERMEAHIQGACVGAGLEMAAWASRITAGSNAWFQLPELAMGLIPGAGGCVSLVRRIGRSRTALLLLSGRRLSARQALAWGLVDVIVD